MKKLTYFVGGVLICLLCSSVVHAEPRPGGSEGKDYLINTSDLGYWCFGAYTLHRDRQVEVSGLTTSLLEQKNMAYVGFHAMPWATLYGSFGQSSRDLGTGFDESEGEYGVGIHFNILDHMFSDPYLIEDRIRLNGYVQYLFSKTAAGLPGDDTLEERSASLLLSIISKPDAGVSFWPDAIALYLGVVYSDIESSMLNESDTMGYTAGLEFFITESISLYIGLESFEESGYRAGLHVDL